jgi:5-formyltetrahydrofolate cyclo-ligase
MNTREEQRRRVLALRGAIPEPEHQARSQQATARLRELMRARNATYIHCYISIRSELRTRELISGLLEEGVRVVVPVVEELDGASFLVHTEIKGLHSLQRGRFGLDEPIERSAARLDGLDLVVLPLAAFDTNGNRLGYGKGFYDRFLSELSPTVLRVGLGFDLQEVDRIETHDRDQPLDIIVTETRTIIAKKSGGKA